MTPLDTHGNPLVPGHGQAWHTNPSVGLRGLGNNLEEIAKVATAEVLNEMVAEVYELSQQEVPKSGTEDDRNRFGETLAESGKYPGNDPELAATPVNLIAQVLYDHPAARAQHEGHMVYERNGKSVTWVVHNYSTAGTKAHYLSDPFKAVWPKLEERVALRIREKLGESLV